MDTSKTIEVYQSPWRMALLLVLGVAMTALAALLLFLPVLPGAKAAVVGVAGWTGVVFFGACTLLIFWRWFTVRGPVIVVSPAGWHDRRVSASPVPWTSVRGIATWQFRGPPMIIVSVDPETEASIGLTRIVRWSRGANAALGADGLCVNASGLMMGHDELIALFQAFAQAANPHARPKA